MNKIEAIINNLQVKQTNKQKCYQAMDSVQNSTRYTKKKLTLVFLKLFSKLEMKGTVTNSF